MYGTDIADNPPNPAHASDEAPTTDAAFEAEVDRNWRSDWRYLATPLTEHVEDIKTDVKGLARPRGVIDKLYYKNAERIYLHRK
jgi:hypothetical protein